MRSVLISKILLSRLLAEHDSASDAEDCDSKDKSDHPQYWKAKKLLEPAK